MILFKAINITLLNTLAESNHSQLFKYFTYGIQRNSRACFVEEDFIMTWG